MSLHQRKTSILESQKLCLNLHLGRWLSFQQPFLRQFKILFYLMAGCDIYKSGKCWFSNQKRIREKSLGEEWGQGIRTKKSEQQRYSTCNNLQNFLSVCFLTPVNSEKARIKLLNCSSIDGFPFKLQTRDLPVQRPSLHPQRC